MRSHFRIAGHPAHPMLVMFPVALLPLLLVLDAVHGYTADAGLWTAGFWVGVVGLVTTLVAIVPGLVDLAAIPNESRAHRTAVFHTIVGFTILATYAAAVWARWPAGSAPDRFGLALGIDIVGTLLVTLQGWLGGELVYRHHIGVDDDPQVVVDKPRPAGRGEVRTPAEGGDPVALEGGKGSMGRTGGARRPRPGKDQAR